MPRTLNGSLLWVVKGNMYRNTEPSNQNLFTAVKQGQITMDIQSYLQYSFCHQQWYHPFIWFDSLHWAEIPWNIGYILICQRGLKVEQKATASKINLNTQLLSKNVKEMLQPQLWISWEHLFLHQVEMFPVLILSPDMDTLLLLHHGEKRKIPSSSRKKTTGLLRSSKSGGGFDMGSINTFCKHY